MELRELDGDAALVTGASSGIGRETALALAREGADVALAARSEESLEAVAGRVREHGREALVVPTDVRDHESVGALVDRTVGTFGKLDVAVCNAGVLIGKGVRELATDEYRALTGTNVDGAFFTTRAVLPHLIDSAGHLVFMGSIVGKQPRSYDPVYAASKWWIRGFAQSVAAEVGNEGVAVTTINPGEVRTGAAPDGTPFTEQYEKWEITEPEEVAEAVVFAARQPNSTVSELDLYTRDKFTTF